MERMKRYLPYGVLLLAGLLVWMVLSKLDCVTIDKIVELPKDAPVTFNGNNLGLPGRESRPIYVPPESPRVLEPAKVPGGAPTLKYSIAGLTVAPAFGLAFHVKAMDIHWMASVRLIYVEAFGLDIQGNDRGIGASISRRFKAPILGNCAGDVGVLVPWDAPFAGIPLVPEFTVGLKVYLGNL